MAQLACPSDFLCLQKRNRVMPHANEDTILESPPSLLTKLSVLETYKRVIGTG